MPVFFRENNKDFFLIVWKIIKNEEFDNKKLSSVSKDKLKYLKKNIHKKQFLSSREILNLINVEDEDIMYDDKGKPYIVDDERKISFSHSGIYSAIAISNNNIGLDIETKFDKIEKVISKFLSDKEMKMFSNRDEYIKAWCTKESIYKILDKKKSMREIILDLDFQFSKEIKSTVLRFEDFYVCVSFEKKD